MTPTTGRILVRYLLPLTVLTAGLACAARPPGDPGDQPGSGARPATSAASDDFSRDADTAIATTERYWADRFRQAGRSFQPVRRVVQYRTDGAVSCGGQPLTRNNAAYCVDGDFIAYDVAWARAAYDEIGDAFIYYMLEHEYGHAVQERLGLSYRFTIEQELQADCLAGADIGDSVRAGWLELQEGDIDELRQGLLAVADDPDQPWFAAGAHGNAQQRTDAFFAGYRRSLSACGLSP